MIKTWNQRCQEHPDHQTGMVSHHMIALRMQEEIDALRAALAQPERKPLTDEEIDAACGPCDDSDLARGFRKEFIRRFRVIYERAHWIGGEHE